MRGSDASEISACKGTELTLQDIVVHGLLRFRVVQVLLHDEICMGLASAGHKVLRLGVIKTSALDDLMRSE